MELTFEEGDVLKVINTMPVVNNMWKVIKVNSYGHEKEEGLVTIEQTVNQWKVSAGTSSSFPSRFAANRRLNSQPGPELFHSLPFPNTGCPYDLYQPVKMFKGIIINDDCQGYPLKADYCESLIKLFSFFSGYSETSNYYGNVRK